MWVNWIRFHHFGPRRVPNFTGSDCAPSSTHRTRPRFPSLFFSFKGCGCCRRKNNKTQLSRFTPAAVFKVRQRHNITSRQIKKKNKKIWPGRNNSSNNTERVRDEPCDDGQLYCIVIIGQEQQAHQQKPHLNGRR